MVLEDEDANRRSVGSFFVNPVIDDVKLAALNEHSRRTGALAPTESVPTFPAGESEFKVPAAWLIEKAGFSKGLRRGGVGISSKHALALVHFGEGTSEELVALAREIRNGVDRKFAIKLEPEPVFLGFPSTSPLED
jgi:UDP-N-acetylmuramate dehydrogenase